ncbi:MAG: methyltransferase [Rhodospirillales bacterium 20-64-7]|nr:MAG: methyltransferase [Rhodospirillales bacterium 20-64-7]HQT76019.1 SAM-dependent methyltransferase [Rhodopila sp.]
MIRAAYLAADGFEAPLAEELGRRGVAIGPWIGRLLLSADPPVQAAWALDTWTDPREADVPSVKAAADTLRAIQRNWSAYGVAHHRRMALITERLPPVKAAPLVFPAAAPTSHLGAWTLLAADRMLFSTAKSSPFVNGECHFVEDRAGPPSRAYLKVWEALVRLGRWPAPGERCIDLGASPGGWTWVLAKLGASVIAVDKAPLDPAIVAMPGVEQRLDSAFALAPEPVDWLFSDVIAYPDRLLAMVRRWIDAGAARTIICTIKFQGPTDHDAAEAFAAIPGARVIHLFNNKHELTFIWGAC